MDNTSSLPPQSSSAASEEELPLATDDQIQKVIRSGETLLKEMDANEIDSPELLALLKDCLTSITTSNTTYQSNAEQLKTLSVEWEKTQRTIEELKLEEDDLTLSTKLTIEDTTKLHNDEQKTRNNLHTAQQQLAVKKAKIAGLETTKAFGSSWTKDQTQQREELEAQLASATAALAAQRSILTTLRQEVSMLTDHALHAANEKSKIDQQVTALKDSITNYRTISIGLQRTKDMKDKQLIEAQTTLVALSAELKERTAVSEIGQKDVIHAQETLKKDRQTLDRYVKEYERLQAKAVGLTGSIDEVMRQNSVVAKEIMDLEEKETGLQNDETHLRKEKVRYEKLHKLTLEKITETATKIAEAETRVATLRTQVEEAEHEIHAEEHKLESKQTAFTETVREKEVIAKGLTKQGDKTKGALAAVNLQQGIVRQLQGEINAYITSMRRLRTEIEELQHSRDKLVVDLEQAAQAYFTAAEGVKLQELQIAALQKRIDEGEIKVRQQESLYQAAKTDRNAYSKQLVLAHGELNELKHEFKTLSHRIEGLKEDIMSKDQALVKHHFEHHRTDKEKEALRAEAGRVSKQVQACEHIGANQESEIKKLTAIVADAEAEYTRQRKELEAVKTERALLLQQMHKRDAELSAIYGKLQIQKSMLANGAVAFAKKVAERDTLAAKIASKKGELLLANTQVADTSNLEKECAKLDQDLQAEKAKIRSLTEELETPINVHRWRALQDRDPTKWAAISRLHELQRRVLEVRDGIKEREEAIKVAEAEYNRLKGHLSKAPTNELNEAIAVYQSNLKDKAKQIKALETEVEASRTKVEDYKREMARLDEAMERLNTEYIRRMKGAKRRHTSLGTNLATVAAQAVNLEMGTRAGTANVNGSFSSSSSNDSLSAPNETKEGKE